MCSLLAEATAAKEHAKWMHSKTQYPRTTRSAALCSRSAPPSALLAESTSVTVHLEWGVTWVSNYTHMFHMKQKL